MLMLADACALLVGEPPCTPRGYCRWSLETGCMQPPTHKLATRPLFIGTGLPANVGSPIGSDGVPDSNGFSSSDRASCLPLSSPWSASFTRSCVAWGGRSWNWSREYWEAHGTPFPSLATGPQTLNALAAPPQSLLWGLLSPHAQPWGTRWGTPLQVVWTEGVLGAPQPLHLPCRFKEQ